MISDYSYIHIAGWMVNRLGLSGNELMIYAAIFGFSQDNESKFHGSGAYLANWCGCSLRSVQRALKALQDRGLIEQVYHSADNKVVEYGVVKDTYDKMSQGTYDKMSQDLRQNDARLTTNCRKAYDKMSQANNDDIIDDNIADNIVDNIEGDIVVCETTKRPRFQKPTFEEVKTYIEENGYTSVDPDRFYAYYEANGWKVGRNSMKDFKAAVRMWSARDKNDQKKRPAAEKILENEYTPEHLKQSEDDSLKLLDDLLKED